MFCSSLTVIVYKSEFSIYGKLIQRGEDERKIEKNDVEEIEQAILALNRQNRRLNFGVYILLGLMINIRKRKAKNLISLICSNFLIGIILDRGYINRKQISIDFGFTSET